MENCLFQLSYIDAASGQSVTRVVSTMRLAQQLARELAMASGRRAIITRVATSDLTDTSRLWTMRLAHCETGEVIVLWNGLTKRQVFARWRLWKERRTQCVLVAWPDWAPLELTIKQAG